MDSLSKVGIKQAWCGDEYELEYISTAVFRGKNIVYQIDHSKFKGRLKI